MMQRGHAKNALAREFKRGDLQNNRNGFHHEQAADDGQNNLMFDDDRDRANGAAQRERTCVAHEDQRRGRIEPQKAKASADQSAAKDGEFASAGDVDDLQIIGKHRVANQIGDDAEA